MRNWTGILRKRTPKKADDNPDRKNGMEAVPTEKTVPYGLTAWEAA